MGPPRRSHRTPIHITRDLILFCVGLAGIAHEVFIASPRPELLLLFGAMVGLPAFLYNDHKDG